MANKSKNPKELYRAEYHVVEVIYLERGRELSGPDFAKLWSGMAVFGKQKGLGGFWHKEKVVKQQRVEIGSLDLVRPLLASGSEPIFGGGTYGKRMARGCDFDFYYEHTDASRNFGGETQPHLMASVSGKWFEQTGVEIVLEKYRQALAVADQYSPPYGLIDIAPTADCYGGLVYSSTFFGNSPLHRWAEEMNWVYCGSKSKGKARGIYWGNYFGPTILDRLGGKQRFLARIRNYAKLPNGEPTARIWEFPNGVFVSLSVNPLDCKPGPAIRPDNLSWLVCELGRHGVLDQWSRWNDVPYDPDGPSATAHMAIVFPGAAELVEEGACSDLNDAERKLIKRSLSVAQRMARQSTRLGPKRKLDAEGLDALFAEWLHAWHEERVDKDPTPVINAVGLAFGQWLVDSLGLKWKSVRNTTSCGMGARYHADGLPALVFPTQLVAKRLPCASEGVLWPVYNGFYRRAASRIE